VRYPFRCPKCALEFDVSRPARDAGKAASCPIDGAAAERVFTVPVTNLKRPPSSTPAAPSAGFSHSGHAHGPGTGHHSH
jgi:putative FmdB family regulatory protein